MAGRIRIVVTGVSRGLGRAMVAEFVRQGHTVAGAARSVDSVAELKVSYPPPHDFAVVDVCQEQQVADWAARMIEEDGPPDLLLNNAALMNPKGVLWEQSASDFSDIVEVNIKGTFHVIRHFLPSMVERGAGVIVNFSSTWGRSVSPEVAPYCATKWAIEGLTRAMAAELPRGMAAVPLNPGIIDTDMLRSCFGSHASAYAGPEDWAAKAVPFLLSLGPKDNGKPLTVQ